MQPRYNPTNYTLCESIWSSWQKGEECPVSEGHNVYSSSEYLAFPIAMSYMVYKNQVPDLKNPEFKRLFEIALKIDQISDIISPEDAKIALDMRYLRAKTVRNVNQSLEELGNNVINFCESPISNTSRIFLKFAAGADQSKLTTIEELQKIYPEGIPLEKIKEFWDVLKFDDSARDHLLWRIADDLKVHKIQVDELIKALKEPSSPAQQDAQATVNLADSAAYVHAFTTKLADTIQLYGQLRNNEKRNGLTQKKVLESFDAVCKAFDLNINIQQLSIKTYEEILHSLRGEVATTITDRIRLIGTITSEVQSCSEKLSKQIEYCREKKFVYNTLSADFINLNHQIKDFYSQKLDKLKHASKIFGGVCLASSLFAAIAPFTGPVVGPILGGISALGVGISQMKLSEYETKRLAMLDKASSFLEKENKSAQLLGFLSENNLNMLLALQKERRNELNFLKANRDYIFPSQYDKQLDSLQSFYTNDIREKETAKATQKTEIEVLQDDVNRLQREVDLSSSLREQFAKATQNFDYILKRNGVSKRERKEIKKDLNELTKELLRESSNPNTLNEKKQEITEKLTRIESLVNQLDATEDVLEEDQRSLTELALEMKITEYVKPLSMYREKLMKQIPIPDEFTKSFQRLFNANLTLLNEINSADYLLRQPIYKALSTIANCLKFIGDANNTTIIGSILSRAPDVLNLVNDFELVKLNADNLASFCKLAEDTLSNYPEFQGNVISLFEKIGAGTVIAGCVVPAITLVGAVMNIGVGIYKIVNPPRDRSLEVIQGMMHEVVSVQKKLLSSIFQQLTNQNQLIIKEIGERTQELKESIDEILVNFQAGNEIILAKIDRKSFLEYEHRITNLSYTFQTHLTEASFRSKIKKIKIIIQQAQNPYNNGKKQMEEDPYPLSVIKSPGFYTGYLYQLIDKEENLSSFVLFKVILDRLLEMRLEQPNDMTQDEKEELGAIIDNALTEVNNFIKLMDNVWSLISETIVAKNIVIDDIKKSKKNLDVKALALENTNSAALNKWKQECTNLSAFARCVLGSVVNEKRYYHFIGESLQESFSLKDLAHGRKKDEETVSDSLFGHTNRLWKITVKPPTNGRIDEIEYYRLYGYETVTLSEFYNSRFNGQSFIKSNRFHQSNAGAAEILRTFGPEGSRSYQKFHLPKTLLQTSISIGWGKKGIVSYSLSPSSNWSELDKEDLKNIPAVASDHLEKVSAAFTRHLNAISQSSQNGDVVLCSMKQDLIPLRFPKEVIDRFNKLVAVNNEVLETYNEGSIQLGSYDLREEKESYEMTLQYYVSPDRLYNEFVIARFDKETLEAFKYFKPAPTEQKDIVVQGPNFNEFLIQTMYGDQYQLGLPGRGSYKLKNISLIVPVERQFKGLYQIFKESQRLIAFNYVSKNNNNPIIGTNSTVSERYEANAVIALSERKKNGFFRTENFKYKKMKEFKENHESYKKYDSLYYLIISLLRFQNPNLEPATIQKSLQVKLRLYAPQDVSLFFIESRMDDLTLFTESILSVKSELGSNSVRNYLASAKTRLEEWKNALTS